MTKEESQQAIAQLVAKYQSWNPRQRRLNEQQTRTQFILPLLQLLGWDINNPAEVSEEFSIAGDRVDYALQIDGVPKLFLEAKRLGADLENVEYIKKAVTYAQNKGITWVVLTSFEQLMVFNADWDDPFWQNARFLNLSFPDYLSDFGRLWWLSKEAVSQGVLNEEARQVGKLRPKVPVEKSLLEKLRRWRAELFKELRTFNEGLAPLAIDHLIQVLLNRLIFIRTAEDRITKVDSLKSELSQWQHGERKGELIERLRKVFVEFANQYDSDLFPNLALPGTDDWDQLFVTGGVLEDIIQGLYDRPGRLSGYDFSAIDADILGQVYEQYLGYVAQEFRQQVAQGRLFGPQPSFVEVEEKRAKRKQQGIYYTPKFVVDYIVDQTVGRFLKERSHNEILNMKILDPACGSGSFLIAAYDRLLQYHARQQGIPVSQLPWALRTQILTNNIFGVDLDLQAVEIARLNLLLKALCQAELLPPLHNNIRRGNSLISGSPEELKGYFGDRWREDKHPFNWEEEFPDIMKAGGFDVVIGNPPYVSFGLRGSERAEEHLSQYLRDKFPNSAEYKLSTYSLFIDRGLQLLKEGSYLSYILPDSFLLGRFFSKLRKRILNSCVLREVVLFAEDFWSGGTIGLPVIPTLQRVGDSQSRKNNQVGVRLCAELNELQLGTSSKSFSYEQSYFEGLLHHRFRLFFDEISKSIVDKLEYFSLPLRNVADIYSGCIGRFGQGSIKSKTRLKKLEIRDQLGNLVFSDDNAERHWQPLLESGREIGRYLTDYAGGFVYYNPSEASKRIYAKSGFEEENYIGEKLFLRQTGDSLVGTYDSENYFCLNNMHVIHLLPDATPLSLKYIVAIVNSKLMNHYYHLISLERGRAMAQTDIETIEQLPIRRIDFDNPEEKKRHDDLVALVEGMLDLKKRLVVLDRFADEERRELEREIERKDRAIDSLVYDLYGLTEAERQIIEAEVKR